MAGEFKVAQIGQAIDPKSLPIMAAVTVGNAGALFVTEHTIVVGAGGADDVTLFNANFPVNGRVAFALMTTTTPVGGSSVALRDAAGGVGNMLSNNINTAAAGTLAGLGVVNDAVLGGSVFLRRSDSLIAGRLLIVWFMSTAGAGTTDLPGVITASQATALLAFGSAQVARESVLGVSVPYIHASAVIAGADVALAATTPAKSRLAFALMQITLAGAGASTCTVRNAPAAGGNTLATFATDVASVLLTAIGPATTTPAGTVLYVNKSDAAATMDVCLIFVPVD